MLAVREGGTGEEKADFSDEALEGGDKRHGLGELAEGGNEEGKGGRVILKGEEGADVVHEGF